MSKGWIACDLDGTLAKYEGWKNAGHIGEPVPKMLARVRAWLAQGMDVRIFTARVGPQKDPREVQQAAMAIDAWCMKHLGRALPVTATKDYGMVELWDDRCVQIIPNTGERVDHLNDMPDLIVPCDSNASAAAPPVTLDAVAAILAVAPKPPPKRVLVVAPDVLNALSGKAHTVTASGSLADLIRGVPVYVEHTLPPGTWKFVDDPADVPVQAKPDDDRRCWTCVHATRLPGHRVDCAKGEGHGIDSAWSCGQHEGRP